MESRHILKSCGSFSYRSTRVTSALCAGEKELELSSDSGHLAARCPFPGVVNTLGEGTTPLPLLKLFTRRGERRALEPYTA